MKRLIRMCVFALAALMCAHAALAETSGQQLAETAGRGLVGAQAPRLVLKTIEGETIDLGGLYGKKAVYLKFWATWCVPCREQMPHFERTYQSAGPDLAVIAVNAGFNDSIEEIRKYRTQLGITMPIVFDDTGRVGAAFHLRVTPQHIVIGRDGRIQYVGHLADARLDAALAAAKTSTAAGARSLQAEQAVARQIRIGDKLPNAAAKTLDGKSFPFRSPALKGPTAYVFLSPWCESYLATTRPMVSANCRIARERVAVLSRDGRVRWLGVASGLWATTEDLGDYRTKYKVDIPLTLDESGTLFREFGVGNTPTVVLANAEGTVVRRVEADEVRSLETILNEL